MKSVAIFSFLLILSNLSFAQEKNIVSVIDELTVKWDRTAIELRTYQSITNFCEDTNYRSYTVNLLDQIHHWDTTLYFIVQDKFDISQDKEAAATLEDIEKLETDYTTEKFKNFIQEECAILKVIESHFDPERVKKYENEIKSFEKESNKYILSITERIDIIDEHVHHLDLDE